LNVSLKMRHWFKSICPFFNKKGAEKKRIDKILYYNQAVKDHTVSSRLLP